MVNFMYGINTDFLLIKFSHYISFIRIVNDLKKTNPHLDRKSVDDHDSTSRALFTGENTDGEI
jgi:hypothetical protein